MSVNRELAALKSMFNRLIDWGRYDAPNPINRLKPSHKAEAAERLRAGQ